MRTQHIIRVAAFAAAILISTGIANAGDKKIMHCFAWTSIKEATPADWDAFFKASDALPRKIRSISHIWYGKLAAPLSQTMLGTIDPESFKKYRAGEKVTNEVSRVTRDWGMCMEMASEDALKAYDTDPYHKIWTDAYAKIRVDGTTTFNIIGQ
jgi:hypothetical protein